MGARRRLTCLSRLIIYSLQVGFRKGDEIHFYSHPLSMTENVRYIYGQSNVGEPGRWVYRVDVNNIAGAR